MKVLKELGKLTAQPSKIHPGVHMTSQGFLFNTLATGVNYKENKAKIISLHAKCWSLIRFRMTINMIKKSAMT